jgi:uncharacterized DUF497 family protein
MKFVWDERKSQINRQKHGLSFADAYAIFDHPMLVDEDDRFDYGEERWVGIGRLANWVVVIVYTETDEETIRIISLRKAVSYEQDAYEQFFGK